MDKKHALVLAGGGARGSYQIGVWQALRELDWPIDVVTGTSVGALNGAMVVQDSFHDALEMWNLLDTGMVLDMEPSAIDQMKKGIWGTIGVFSKELITKGGADYSALQKIVNDFVDEDKVRSSPRELGIVTVEMLTLAPHRLFKEEIEPGRLNDYLLASAACFPAFHSYEIDHVKYIDGAYSDNMPIQMALDRGAQEIIAVDLNAMGIVHKNLIQLPQVIHIQCSWDLGGFLMFDQARARRNIRLGYLDGLKAFHIFDGRFYAFARDAFKRLIRQKKPEIHQVLHAVSADFSTSSHRAVDNLRRVILEKNLAHYTGGSLSLEHLLLTCAESAGRIFGLNPETIYTIQSFDEQLQSQVKASLEELRQEFGPDFPNMGSLGLDKLPAFFRNWNSKAISLGLSAVLHSWLQRGAQGDFVPLATLFPKELAAAFYLMVTGLSFRQASPTTPI